MFWLVLNISLGLLILSFTLFMTDAGYKTVAGIIASKFVITPENEQIYNSWVEPPLGTMYNYYLWEVTNSDQVIKNGTKPELREVGPFCYENTNKKVNISQSNSECKSYLASK